MTNCLQAATEQCCSQLATPSFGPEGSAQLIERLASAALLLMAWSISSPHVGILWRYGSGGYCSL